MSPPSAHLASTGAHRRIPRKNWPFLLCGSVLLLAAIGLDPLLDRLEHHYRKTAISPRVPLSAFDQRALTSFKTPPEDSPFIDHQSDDEAASDDLLLLRLQDVRAVGAEDQALLFVTYYSDANDRVPHTPEVCYRQIGGIIRSLGTTSIELTQPGQAPLAVNVRTVVAEVSGAQAVIAFVFCVNGRYYCDRNDVRLALGWPGDQSVYFAKIEAVTNGAVGSDPTAALQRCLTLVKEALPELVQVHFPRDVDVRRG